MQVNEVQARLRDVTRKMKAVISELSMNQAMSMQLHQEMNDRELAVQQVMETEVNVFKSFRFYFEQKAFPNNFL